ncbi:alpha/beta fold hydrolase [Halopseudomonas sp.]|uniref:alpha/beta fold hydrolase n=1 Tax=Halopseudomonas sp. TaxID=2901191 RepID=UPI0030034BC1
MKVQANGVTTEVYVRGAGQPVLMLHGNPDSHVMWLPLIAKLRGNYRLIVPDLPGFGASKSRADHAEVTLQGMADWVGHVLDATQVDRPVDLLLHDFGGVYGLAFATAYPERVRRLIITNTVFQQDYRWHFWGRVWRTPRLGELSMALMGIPGLGKLMFSFSLRAGGPGLSKQQIAEAYRHFTPEVRQQVLRLYRATDPANFAGWETRMLAVTADHPTLVLWGQRDPYIPARYAERFGAARIERFAEVGHWVVVEAADRVAPLIDSHLQDGAAVAAA